MLDIDIIKEKNKLINLLKNSKNVLLINHRRMDWDAFWSLSWFYYILKKLWKHNIMAVNDDVVHPEIFNFLNNENIFTSQDIKKFNPDLIISFDVAWIEQYWEIYKNNLEIFLNTTNVCIDHHTSNTWIWSVNIIDIDASSTCEIVYDLIKLLWHQDLIDEKISSFLLTWIISDTNSFYNSNSTSKALKSAWELMNYDPRHQEIILNLFKKKPYHRLKLWWKILENLKDLKEWKIVWNTVPLSLFIQTWTTNNDISWLIDEFLTTIDWLDIWFLLYELDHNVIKWTFRAKNDNIDLSKFCEKWGGWGHKRASWFVVKNSNLYEVEQEVIQELSKLIK